MQQAPDIRFDTWLERLGVRTLYEQAERLPGNHGCGNQTDVGHRLARRYALEAGRRRLQVIHNPNRFA